MKSNRLKKGYSLMSVNGYLDGTFNHIFKNGSDAALCGKNKQLKMIKSDSNTCRSCEMLYYTELDKDSLHEVQSENAIEWINELKTTEHKQKKCTLGEPESGFCCLGLGLYIQKTHYCPYDGVDSLLPFIYGLKYSLGVFLNTSLAILNDDKNFTFKQIAEEIENNLHELFEPDTAKLIEQKLKKG